MMFFQGWESDLLVPPRTSGVWLKRGQILPLPHPIWVVTELSHRWIDFYGSSFPCTFPRREGWSTHHQTGNNVSRLACVQSSVVLFESDSVRTVAVRGCRHLPWQTSSSGRDRSAPPYVEGNWPRIQAPFSRQTACLFAFKLSA